MAVVANIGLCVWGEVTGFPGWLAGGALSSKLIFYIVVPATNSKSALAGLQSLFQSLSLGCNLVCLFVLLDL